MLATALLAISICTVTDRRNIAGAGHTGSDRANHMMPGMLGLTVLGLGVSLGFNCGYPLNPARDLAPRLFMGNISLYIFIINISLNKIHVSTQHSASGLDVG